MQCKYNILFTGVWLRIKFLNTKFLLSMESITSHLVIKFEKAGTDDNRPTEKRIRICKHLVLGLSSYSGSAD